MEALAIFLRRPAVDLRTRLVFALVGVSLASMLALGAVAYTAGDALLTDRSLRHLSALAETKKEDLERVREGWEDRVALVASRTQLRMSLAAHNRDGRPERRQRIGRILADATRSSDVIRAVTAYGIDGEPVASASDDPTSPEPPGEAGRPGEPPEQIALRGVSFLESGETRIDFAAPLDLDGERIGALRVVLDGRELRELVENVIGLGRTGETIVVIPVAAGAVRMVASSRHADAAPDSPAPTEPTEPARLALRGEEGPFTGEIEDRRGVPVWVATRRLPEVGWGVVVKFDAAEEREPIVEFRNRLARLGFSLSAFAILVGTLLGLRLAAPIHDLAEVASRIGVGELGARTEIRREDEIGLLARTFNEMAEQVEEQMTLLREYEKFFEVSLDMLCIAGTDGYFKRVNPAFERTLGWSTEELLDRPFVEFVHPDDVDDTLEEIEKLARGVPTLFFENRYRCADGSYKELLWAAYPDPHSDRIYAVARDMSGRAEPPVGPGSAEGSGGSGDA